jgi:hypothetical protein
MRLLDHLNAICLDRYEAYIIETHLLRIQLLANIGELIFFHSLQEGYHAGQKEKGKKETE